MKVFVGLGNPGPQYSSNLHNLGFMSLDKIAHEERLCFKAKKNYEVAEFPDTTDKVYLLKPMTFMNLSGDAVIPFISFYKGTPEDIWLIMDDVSLPFGSIRIRESGSDGGHKGLRDIILKSGTDKIKRVRIGCGPVPPKMELDRFVLMNIPSEQKKIVGTSLEDVHNIFKRICDGATVKDLMNEFNKTFRIEKSDEQNKK